MTSADRVPFLRVDELWSFPDIAVDGQRARERVAHIGRRERPPLHPP
jgi:hypothetical protein